MNIYVGNLSHHTTVDSLKTMFEAFGKVESVKVLTNKFPGNPNFGFVEMPSNSEADKAIKELNRKLVDGNNIKVNPADPGGKQRAKKPFRRRGY